MALSRVISEIFNVENVVTLKSGSEVTRGHSAVGFMASVTCGLTAEDRDKLRNLTLVSGMGIRLPHHSVTLLKMLVLQ